MGDNLGSCGSGRLCVAYLTQSPSIHPPPQTPGSKGKVSNKNLQIGLSRNQRDANQTITPQSEAKGKMAVGPLGRCDVANNHAHGPHVALCSRSPQAITTTPKKMLQVCVSSGRLRD